MIGLVWLRRDLRLEDHHALSLALTQCRQIYLTFVFDTDILSPLLARGLTADRRVEFIWYSLQEIDASLRQWGGGLIVRHGQASQELPQLAIQLGVQAVYTHQDDEPSALTRDTLVAQKLAAHHIGFHALKDHVIFARDEILTGQGRPYAVFTPYKNAWLQRLQVQDIAALPVPLSAQRLARMPPAFDTGLPTLAMLGFSPAPHTERLAPGSADAQRLLADFLARMPHYHQTRDFPSIKGPSYLSVHLRFGTLSIRSLVRAAHQAMLDGCAGASVWLSELIWREFYGMLLSQYPHLAHGKPFKPEYAQIQWLTGDVAHERFHAWCQGKTGYPLIDSAMLQLKHSGYMHNRLRMVTASFLCKHLGLDWRWGEQYFADQLNDFELASNNGGWQWAASCGCDAQPYFRIFNPITQSQKFDAQGHFIRKYLPQLARLDKKLLHTPWLAPASVLAQTDIVLGHTYPYPIVDHQTARQETLQRYGIIKRKER